MSTPEAPRSDDAAAFVLPGDALIALAFRRALDGDYGLGCILAEPDSIEERPTEYSGDLDARFLALREATKAMVFARQGSMNVARAAFAGAIASLRELAEFDAALQTLNVYARYETLSGRTASGLALMTGAVPIAASDCPQALDEVNCTLVRTLVFAGNVRDALRVECGPDPVTAVVLASATGHAETLDRYGHIAFVETLIERGMLRDAFDLTVALMHAWRGGRRGFDEKRLLSIVLRSVRDPLDAAVVLVDVAEHGRIDDAEESAALLSVLALRAEFVLVRALHLLSLAYLDNRHRRVAAGVTHAADAARLFTEIEVHTLQSRAMDLLVSASAVGDESARQPGRLTRRQRQIVALLRVGAANKGIANALGISEHTVERHVSAVLDELNLRSRWQLLDPYIHEQERD